MEEIHSSPGTEPQQVASGPPLIEVATTTTIEVTTPAALISALSSAKAGYTILLTSPTYTVETPLLVPDDVTLRGVGVMELNPQGFPLGFQGTTTKIKAGPGLKGNLLTLSNRSKVETLVLEGANKVDLDAAGRGGHVVAVASRAREDIVSATIDKCELINRNKSGGGPETDGPTGGAILVYTRNPQKPAPDPAPHEKAEVTLTLTRSIVRTPKDGKAVFAMNFASRGMVTISLTNNDIRGPLDVIGGLSRPDAVDNATTTITSRGSQYSPQPASDVEAWHIIGGSSYPFGGNAKTDSNSVSVESNDDKIENFLVGIAAVGGRRLPEGGTCSRNTVKLKLRHMTLATNAADFMFVGAQSGGLFPAGNGNTVQVDVQDTTGSGLRENVYADSMGLGNGNQLVFVGTLAAFTTSNPGINPAPPAGFF